MSPFPVSTCLKSISRRIESTRTVQSKTGIPKIPYHTAVDWVDVGRSKQRVPILVELDGTTVRSCSHNLKETSGVREVAVVVVVSFVCVGLLVRTHTNYLNDERRSKSECPHQGKILQEVF